MFINTPIQQPDGQLQTDTARRTDTDRAHRMHRHKQGTQDAQTHTGHTGCTDTNRAHRMHRHTQHNRKLKSQISTPYYINLMMMMII